MNAPKQINYSDGSVVPNPVVQIWEDLHTERSGYFRAFWCASSDASCGSPVIGYCSPGGSHRTIRAVAREVWRMLSRCANLSKWKGTEEMTNEQTTESPIVRVRDLTDQTRMPFPRPILRCDECGASFSANKGDYFAAHPDTPMMCCGEPLVMVVKREVYERVR